ncbi:NAD(P)-binding protein-7 [Coleophoma crateriformis]|uniref:NAD(P)-binding protein-7 n=1 Tax=Coleophoma crateriformis TaxID=565419 RepID=A0A3D8SAG0_9HELO|nr:NAD(P)-binding protein-7 [Coleophoma crateriformis]
MSMQGKIIAITGGASGIGLAAAKILSSRGAVVAIADINPQALGEASTYFQFQKAEFMITRLEVTDSSEVNAWIQAVVDKYGRLDGAANCAGILGKHHGIRTVAQLEDDEWDRLLAVNLTGLMYCLRAELGKIVDGGSIVNMASIQGLVGFTETGAYVATKHAVIGLTRTAAKENGAKGIRVNALAPGSIDTPLASQSKAVRKGATSAMGRVGTAEEMGYSIAFLLGPESTFTTGAVIVADGGWAC